MTKFRKNSDNQQTRDALNYAVPIFTMPAIEPVLAELLNLTRNIRYELV